MRPCSPPQPPTTPPATARSYYGAEQGMTGFNSNNTNRWPLWEVGYDDTNPLYSHIRTLAWYRWWMNLGNKSFTGGQGAAAWWLGATAGLARCWGACRTR